MSRWRAAFLLWVLVACTACPHAFGKGGTIDRAVLKDMMDNAGRPRPRPMDCEPATLREICLPEKLKECEQQCKAVLDSPKVEEDEEEEW